MTTDICPEIVTFVVGNHGTVVTFVVGCDICRGKVATFVVGCDICQGKVVTIVVGCDICRGKVVTFVVGCDICWRKVVTFVEGCDICRGKVVTFVEGCCDICRGLWHLVGLWLELTITVLGPTLDINNSNNTPACQYPSLPCHNWSIPLWPAKYDN